MTYNVPPVLFHQENSTINIGLHADNLQLTPHHKHRDNYNLFIID